MGMSELAEPIKWNRTIYRGTDHAWQLRRVSEDGTPIVPTSAQAQVRGGYGGTVWVETDIEIDPVDGWLTVRIPEAATTGVEWDSRAVGVWDLEVVVAGQRVRWVQGRIDVSQDVTR